MTRRERVVTYTSLCLLVIGTAFLGGILYRHLDLWPSRNLVALERQIKDYRKFGVWGLPSEYMSADVSAEDPRTVIYTPDEFAVGYRAIMGLDSDLNTYSVRLLGLSGEQIHVWPVSYSSLAGVEKEGSEINPHGLQMLPDGSIVVNFGTRPLMARVDACGNAIWALRGNYHHSIDVDDDGNLWTWFSSGHIGGQLQWIVQFDPETGDHLLEIGLEDVRKVDPRNAVMLALPDGYVLTPWEEIPKGKGFSGDIFHPNDVEPLSKELAEAFPQFSPGDLLISLRSLNLVAVLDSGSMAIKWAKYGPWIRQHDPDFTSDGRIEVYDNATGLGRSGIISLDPVSGEFERLHSPNGPAYYSPTQGKQQRLHNGNHVIVVPNEGRVLEVSRTGNLVFEFNNIIADGVNGRTLNAVWLPPDFYDSVPSCQR